VKTYVEFIELIERQKENDKVIGYLSEVLLRIEENVKEYISKVKQLMIGDGWDMSVKNTKILFLTNNLIASEQKFNNLANCYSYPDDYLKKADKYIQFFLDVVEPTIFADVKNSMTIAQEEIFGPVATLIPFESEEEAKTFLKEHRGTKILPFETIDESLPYELDTN
jgi:hypothetical protein